MNFVFQLETKGQTLKVIQGLRGSSAAAGNNNFPILPSHDTFMQGWP